MNAEKKIILMRGLPGSGKSTLAKKIAADEGVVYSTDDFFMVKGEYKYDFSKIGEYHDKNLERTILAMQKSKPLIIIDNTNIKLWEMRKYVEQAEKYQYEVEIREPETEWAFDARRCSNKTKHGVPEDKIKIMRDNYEKFASLEEIKMAKENFRRNNKKR